jgi:type I restriction enzyme S subunit
VRDEALPESWLFLKLSEVGTWRGGGTPSKANPAFWSGGTIPWVSPKDMKQPKLSAAQDFITESAVESSATNLVASGSVLLVTRSGILAHSLPVAVNLVPVALNQDIKAVTPYPFVDADFLHLLFQGFERDILNECRKGGTTVHSIEFPSLQNFTIPLPPLAEQKRIVAKIEELFSELDAGEESLRVARRQLGVYRQSLLKQAFEGKLTEKWRGHNSDKLEWREVPLASVVEFISGFAFKSSEYIDDGVPVVRISDVSEGGVSLTKTVKISARPEFEKIRLQKGDILIAMSGATTGKFGELKSEEKCYLNQRVGCFRTKDSARFSQRFLLCLLHGLQREIEKDAYGGAQPNISGKQINAYKVPFLSPDEQQEIVRLLDEQFEVIAQNEREIDAALKRSEALRQAILKKAFTGQLVAQDPADEPASALVARLRSERAKLSGSDPHRGHNTAKPPAFI